MEKKAALGTGKDKLTAEYERGAFRPVKHQARARHEAMKDGRITIRLSTADLEMLKRRSAEEGLPSQSLITSILHKYVSRSSPQTHEPVRFLNTYLQNPIGSHHTQYKIQPSDFRSWIRGGGTPTAQVQSQEPTPSLFPRIDRPSTFADIVRPQLAEGYLVAFSLQRVSL